MDEFAYTRKVYNEIAQTYHEKRNDPQKNPYNIYLEMPAMESLLKPLVRGKRVLDLGCGTGVLTREIVDWGGCPSGVDIAENMIAIARAESPDIDFRVANAEKLPFAEGQFDVVASSLVLHYFRDLRPLLREAARVLTSGGHFVFSMHHPFEESFEREDENSGGRLILRPYFNNNHYYWRMCGAEFLSFHHTFEDIFGGLTAVGFTVRDLIECRPAESARGLFDNFEYTSQFPTFCVFHATR